MRVYLGSDHAGFDLKGHLVERLRVLGHEPVDCGAHALDPEDDYPPYCIAAASLVASDPGSLGVVIGGSGNGEQIAANKVKGVRAALVWNDDTARLAREHNDANVTRFLEIFVSTPFSGSERHRRRIGQLSVYESAGALPPA
jgi:ribose 5-phosphate isomerase B